MKCDDLTRSRVHDHAHTTAPVAHENAACTADTSLRRELRQARLT
ncbi:jg11119, partial [Pararge aegeria aegeria]